MGAVQDARVLYFLDLKERLVELNNLLSNATATDGDCLANLPGRFVAVPTRP